MGAAGDAPEWPLGDMGAMCCFCNQPIAGSTTDPVQVVAMSRADATQPPTGRQYLWCHAACLRRAVHPGVPLGVEGQADV